MKSARIFFCLVAITARAALGPAPEDMFGGGSDLNLLDVIGMLLIALVLWIAYEAIKDSLIADLLERVVFWLAIAFTFTISGSFLYAAMLFKGESFVGSAIMFMVGIVVGSQGIKMVLDA